MIVLFERSCAILCLVWLVCGSLAEVKVENKAYQNVVVSFSPRINPDDANGLLNSMKNLLKETSSIIQDAIGLKIGSVIFHVPVSWDSSSLGDISPAPISSLELTPDVRVEGTTDSAFGHQPYALQYGGCGVSGVEITIPGGFLATDSSSYPKGKLLAREWLKYRYGVFDENGFHNDPKYPAYFTFDGSDNFHVTDCTFPEVHYHYKDSNGNNCSLTTEDCKIYPDEESLESVESSLMFFHENLPNMTHVCGKDDYIHNMESPNKHNILCTYQSIWDVIKSSEDFKTEQTSEGNEDLQFSYVQESRIRVVLSWPNTQKLYPQGEVIKKVVRKFLYDLPIHSKYSLYPFIAAEDKIPDLTELVLHSKVEISSSFGNPDEVCISCAIMAAANLLVNDDANRKGIIFMIAASNPEENPDLVNKLKTSNLCLVVAALPGASTSSWSQFIEASECSFIREISNSEDQITVFKSLYETIETILPVTLDDTRTSTVATDWLTSDSTITIPANPMAYSFTLWIFADLEEHSIKCTAENEEIQLNHIMSPSDLLSAHSFRSSNKDVKCSCKYQTCKKALTQVRMTTQKGAYFQAEAWIHNTTPKDSKEQMPIIIYGRLSYGQHPIQGAEIKATVKDPNGQQHVIPLFDDGKGDPDITLGDGIYSRYFTQFTSAGEYTVEITANDNGKNARYGRNGKEPCCGSLVQSESVDVGPFQLSTSTSFSAVSGRPNNGYKPSRVADLKADLSDLPNSLTLKWTAPGGEADHGKASSYEFSVFCQHEDSDKEGALPKWVAFGNEQKPTPKEKGSEENITLIFLESRPQNTTVYFAVRALSGESQYGDLSNRVYVKFDVEQQITTTPTTQKDKESNSPMVGSIIAYVIISVSILLVIVGIVYFFSSRAKQRREFEELKTPQVISGANNTENNVFPFESKKNTAIVNDMPRAESFPVLLYTHDQLKDFKEKVKDPPLYRTDRVPKPWVSLNALTNEENEENNSTSSTLEAEDDKMEYNEMEQLDNISSKSDQPLDKISKF